MCRSFAAIAAALLCAPLVRAELVVDASNSGFYMSQGLHGANTKNPFTGQDGLFVFFQHNGFFTFDLPAFSGPVVGGKLRLGVEAFYGPDSSEHFTLYDVTTPIADLNASHIDTSDIYSDLMSGQIFGEATVLKNDKVAEFELNAAALAALQNAAGHTFAIGIHLDSLGSGGTEGVLWDRFGEPTIHELRLSVVPDAGRSAALLGGSVVALILLARFGRSSQADNMKGPYPGGGILLPAESKRKNGSTWKSAVSPGTAIRPSGSSM
jgi:hypothetical protein